MVLTSNVGLDGIAWLARCMGGSFAHIIGHHEYYLPKDFRFWQFLLWRKAVRSSDKSYAITDFVRNNIVDICGIKNNVCSTVLNSIDLSKEIPARDASWMQSEFGIGKSERVLVFVGRIVHNKGCDMLIKHLGPHLKRWNARLLLVGSHYMDSVNYAFYESLMKLIDAQNDPELINLVGHRSDVNRIIANADVLVHFARHEGFGLVLAEALVAGIPVVATDVGGISEILKESPCLPVPLFRPSDFVEKVEYWLRPSLSSKKTLMKAAHIAEKRYSDTRRTKEIEGILKRGLKSWYGNTV